LNWSQFLKSQLRAHAEAWTSATSAHSYNSNGDPGTILYSSSGEGHGNFIPAAWKVICADGDWIDRTTKRHSQSRHLPLQYQETALEMDSSNSSDALLMNIFCYPGAASRLAPILGATPVDAKPKFGVPGEVRLVDGKVDATEIDMVLGDTIVEAKLTEKDFTVRPKAHVLRYAAFLELFDDSRLLTPRDEYFGFQLIRNVLAAAQSDRRLVVIIDMRRPDLLQEWWQVHGAIRDLSVRSRCFVRFWQELAAEALPDHRKALDLKYGL
jgi:hypothetical protein